MRLWTDHSPSLRSTDVIDFWITLSSEIWTNLNFPLSTFWTDTALQPTYSNQISLGQFNQIGHFLIFLQK